MSHAFKSSLAAAALALTLVSPAQAQAPEPLSAQERAQIESQLQRAREQLEKSVAEVARLSGKLTGPSAYDLIISSHLGRKGAVLGVSIDDSPGARHKDGVVVQSVTPDGPADKAGIKTGDVIVALDGKALKDATPTPGRALIAHMTEVKPGDKVKVELQRNGKKQTVDVTTQEPQAVPMFGRGEGGHVFRFDIDRLRPERGAPGIAIDIGPGMKDMELVAVTPKLGRYFGVDSGLLVVRAPQDAKVKLEEGDVIVDIDGRKPQDSAHAMRILRSYQPGEEVTFNVMRDRKATKVTMEIPQEGLAWSAPPRIRTFTAPGTRL